MRPAAARMAARCGRRRARSRNSGRPSSHQSAAKRRRPGASGALNPIECVISASMLSIHAVGVCPGEPAPGKIHRAGVPRSREPRRWPQPHRAAAASGSAGDQDDVDDQIPQHEADERVGDDVDPVTLGESDPDTQDKAEQQDRAIEAGRRRRRRRGCDRRLAIGHATRQQGVRATRQEPFRIAVDLRWTGRRPGNGCPRPLAAAWARSSSEQASPARSALLDGVNQQNGSAAPAVACGLILLHDSGCTQRGRVGAMPPARKSKRDPTAVAGHAGGHHRGGGARPGPGASLRARRPRAWSRSRCEPPAALAAIEAIARQVPRSSAGRRHGPVHGGLRIFAAERRRYFRDLTGRDPFPLAAAASAPIPYLPAVATASGLMQGLACGYHCFKFFPAGPAGVSPCSRHSRSFPAGALLSHGRHHTGFREVISPFAERPRAGGSWLSPADALAARDWKRIAALASRAAASRTKRSHSGRTRGMPHPSQPDQPMSSFRANAIRGAPALSSLLTTLAGCASIRLSAVAPPGVRLAGDWSSTPPSATISARPSTRCMRKPRRRVTKRPPNRNGAAHGGRQHMGGGQSRRSTGRRRRARRDRVRAGGRRRRADAPRLARGGADGEHAARRLSQDHRDPHRVHGDVEATPPTSTRPDSRATSPRSKVMPSRYRAGRTPTT